MIPFVVMHATFANCRREDIHTLVSDHSDVVILFIWPVKDKYRVARSLIHSLPRSNACLCLLNSAPPYIYITSLLLSQFTPRLQSQPSHTYHGDFDLPSDYDGADYRYIDVILAASIELTAIVVIPSITIVGIPATT
jgi:hypothetical protein